MQHNPFNYLNLMEESLYFVDVGRPIKDVEYLNTILQVSCLCNSTFSVHFSIGFGIFVHKLSYTLSKVNSKLNVSPVKIRGKRSLKCR